MIGIFSVLNNVGNAMYVADVAVSMGRKVPDIVDWVMQNGNTSSPSRAVTSAAVVEALNAHKPETRRPWTRASLFLFISIFTRVSQTEAGTTVQYLLSPDAIVAKALNGYRLTDESRTELMSLMLREIEQVRSALAAIPSRMHQTSSAKNHLDNKEVGKISPLVPLGPLMRALAHLAAQGALEIGKARRRHLLQSSVDEAAQTLVDAGLSSTDCRSALQAQGADTNMIDHALH